MRALAVLLSLAASLLVAMPGAAQEATPIATPVATPTGPLTRLVTCGPLEIILAEYDEVETWGTCADGTQYILGYCDNVQAFDFSATAEEPIRIFFDWHCNPLGYATSVQCLLFPGELHFRVIAKDNTTLKEVLCRPEKPRVA